MTISATSLSGQHRWPWRRVAVAGDSMLPTLRAGDWLVVRCGGRAIECGDLVVAVRPDRPDLLVIKRAVRHDGDSWWLLGDNAQHSDDSRLFGYVPEKHILGRVAFRYWPLRHR